MQEFCCEFYSNPIIYSSSSTDCCDFVFGLIKAQWVVYFIFSLPPNKGSEGGSENLTNQREITHWIESRLTFYSPV